MCGDSLPGHKALLTALCDWHCLRMHVVAFTALGADYAVRWTNDKDMRAIRLLMGSLAVAEKSLQAVPKGDDFDELIKIVTSALAEALDVKAGTCEVAVASVKKSCDQSILDLQGMAGGSSEGKHWMSGFDGDDTIWDQVFAHATDTLLTIRPAELEKKINEATKAELFQ